MKTTHISVDLGDTLFNRKAPKIQYGLNSVYTLFEYAQGVLRGLHNRGECKISIISKIDHGAEARVILNLVHESHSLVPQIISVDDVHFCYGRSEKGEIAKSIGSQIHIDDRVEALHSTHECGVPHNILFIGGHDDRENTDINSKNFLVAHNWNDVLKLIMNLP